MDLGERIELDVASAGDMVEKISYMIWGSIITTTRGFGKVEMKLEPHVKIVFAKVDLRWFVNHKKMKKVHDSWIKIAEGRAEEHLPDGWRLVIYYGNEKV